ncbi:MAG: cysteine peptidase family C39 domain-containing protein [Fimbriimonadaceae bacterium]
MKALLPWSLIAIIGCGKTTTLNGAIPSPLSSGDAMYNQKNFKAAEREYMAFVEKNAKASDTKTQNLVTVARIRTAYSAARGKDFSRARTLFKTASQTHKGDMRPSPAYGNLPDHARYQAIVCLLGENRRAEAIAEFGDFLKSKPESPVCYSVIKRIHQLLPREKWAPYDTLMDRAIKVQNKKVAEASVVCGPKAAGYLLEALGKGKFKQDDLTKLCGTTAKGTSLEGLQSALKTKGVFTKGMLLNRTDFAKMTLPAIWLGDDHYYVVVRMGLAEVTVFDPAIDKEVALDIPVLDDNDFAATVLVVDSSQTKGKQS